MRLSETKPSSLGALRAWAFYLKKRLIYTKVNQSLYVTKDDTYICKLHVIFLYTLLSLYFQKDNQKRLC